MTLKARFLSRRILRLAVLLWLAFVPAAFSQTNDLSGRTADSVRNVLRLVAYHQQVTLADGAYTAVYTTNAANTIPKPAGLTWNYPWGVNLYGQLQASRALGDTNVEDFVLRHNLITGRYYEWLRGLAATCTNANGQPENLQNFYATTALREFFYNDPNSGTQAKLDYCGSMNSALLEGALFHTNGPTPGQILASTNTAYYITSVQGRLPDGTLYRPERSFTVWADDLYMSCPFLVRWYQRTGDTNYLNDAARQVGNMAGYLQDTNGIWYHGYYYTNNAVNGIKWCRANGWAMIATAEVLAVLPADHPAYTNLLSIHRRHLEGIISVQAPSGLWRQILDNTNLWEETSSSAMFSYCIARAVNRGWIDPTNMTFAHKGFVGVCTKIAANGDVGGTCTGTSLNTTLSYYSNLTHNGANEAHGIGPVMLAGSEILLSTNAPPPPALRLVQMDNIITLSWPAVLTNYVMETATNFTDWAILPSIPVLTNNQNVVTDNLQTNRFYHLRYFSTNPIPFEAEGISYVTGGAGTTVQTSDPATASGGLWLSLNATNAGPYIEFTLPNVPAGSYQLKFTYKANTSRGQMSLAVDGNPLGGVLDQYRSSALFIQTNYGSINFPHQTNHLVRLTVTGKAAAATAFTLSADKFTLAPQ